MKVNQATREFNEKVQLLFNQGVTGEEIVEKLEWDKTPLSLVRNGKRNVPQGKYELLLKQYRFDPEPAEPPTGLKDKYIAALERSNKLLQDIIDDLRESISSLEKHEPEEAV